MFITDGPRGGEWAAIAADADGTAPSEIVLTDPLVGRDRVEQSPGSGRVPSGSSAYARIGHDPPTYRFTPPGGPS